ncbi:MAG: hypothetical protein IPH45_12820 [Bacteroidales bacterium]|nr:hypothetical protein [Bacteroidales bacterium]
MKIFISFLLVVILFKQDYSQDHSEYRHIDKYFNTDQKNVLERIITFVDSAVNPETLNIESAYKEYINSLIVDDCCKVQLFDQDIKEKFLMSLPDEVFDKIWIKQIPISVKTHDTTLYYPENFWNFDLNINGDYLKLLRALGKRNSYYKCTSKAIWVSGGLCPTVYANIFSQINEFNFLKLTDRLWLAIFLLTMEESTEIRVSRYLSR